MKNWKIKKIKELGEVITGKTPSTKIKDFWNGDIPFITPTDIDSNKYVITTERHVTTKGLKAVSKLLPANTLLVVCIASIGKIALTTKDSISNQQINAIILDESKYSPNFFYYMMSSLLNKFKSSAGNAVVPIIKKSQFEQLTISVPTFIEQKSIAQILSTVDEAIQKADEAIEHTERLKRGLMQKLLTEGIGHSEFKETKIGRIPKEWEIIELRDLFDLASGKSRPQEFSETKNELYTIPIYGGNGILGFTNQSNVNSEVLVIGRVGEYCGSVHLAPRDSWITDNALFTANLKMGGSMDFHFLKISMVHMNLNRYNRKSGQPLITQSIINDLLIALPPITEQRKIVQMTFSIEQKLQLLKERKYQYAKIKYGLMQDLLTGKKRVVLN